MRKMRSMMLGVALALLAGPALAQVTAPAGGFAGPQTIPITSARNLDGSAIAATAAAGTDFLTSVVADTSRAVLGHTAMSNTKTDTVLFEIIMPTWKTFGSTLTINVTGSYTAVAAPSSAAFATVKLQSLVAAPTIGSALMRTAGMANQILNTSLTGMTWTFDTSTITPGAALLLTISTTVVESDGGTARSELDAVILQ